jgi:hypothetical protein
MGTEVGAGITFHSTVARPSNARVRMPARDFEKGLAKLRGVSVTVAAEDIPVF